ncbi:MAG: hypothetical protein KAT48_14130 [Bacteroidales bacterium]|nr:hypothetical protein [Bacteroidales bacterium]
MMSDRDAFHEFIESIGLRGAMNVKAVQTIKIDPKLRFDRIEKFLVSMLTMEEIESLITYCKSNNIGMYFAFNYLCIGYPEASRHTRLDVF